jgi:hypothetical protein
MITDFKVGDIFVSQKEPIRPVVILQCGYHPIGCERYSWGGLNGLEQFNNSDDKGATKKYMLERLNANNYVRCGNLNEKVRKTLEFCQEQYFEKNN